MSTHRFAIFFKPKGAHARAPIEAFVLHANLGTVDKLLGGQGGQKRRRVIFSTVFFFLLKGG